MNKWSNKDIKHKALSSIIPDHLCQLLDPPSTSHLSYCSLSRQTLLYFEACTTLGIYLPSKGSNPRHGFYETIPFCSHLISDTCQSPNNHLPAKEHQVLLPTWEPRMKSKSSIHVTPRRAGSLQQKAPRKTAPALPGTLLRLPGVILPECGNAARPAGESEK